MMDSLPRKENCNILTFYSNTTRRLARFNSPMGLAAKKNSSLSDANYLYVADVYNNRIRGISAICTQVSSSCRHYVFLSQIHKDMRKRGKLHRTRRVSVQFRVVGNRLHPAALQCLLRSE